MSSEINFPANNSLIIENDRENNNTIDDNSFAASDKCGTTNPDVENDNIMKDDDSRPDSGDSAAKRKSTNDFIDSSADNEKSESGDDVQVRREIKINPTNEVVNSAEDNSLQDIIPDSVKEMDPTVPKDNITLDSEKDVSRNPNVITDADSPQDVIPDSSQHEISDSIQDIIPDSTHDAIHDSTQDVILDSTQDVILDSTQDVIPDSTQDIILDSSQGVMLDSSQGVIPDSSQNVIQDSSQYIIPNSTQDRQDVIPDSSRDIIPNTGQCSISDCFQNLTSTFTHDAISDSEVSEDGSVSTVSDEKHKSKDNKPNLFTDWSKLTQEQAQLALESHSCCICHETLINACRISCGHTYCRWCIDDLREKRGKMTCCPQCLEVVKEVQNCPDLDKEIKKLYSILPTNEQLSRASKEAQRKRQISANRHSSTSQEEIHVHTDDQNGENVDESCTDEAQTHEESSCFTTTPVVLLEETITFQRTRRRVIDQESPEEAEVPQPMTPTPQQQYPTFAQGHASQEFVPNFQPQYCNVHHQYYQQQPHQSHLHHRQQQHNHHPPPHIFYQVPATAAQLIHFPYNFQEVYYAPNGPSSPNPPQFSPRQFHVQHAGQPFEWNHLAHADVPRHHHYQQRWSEAQHHGQSEHHHEHHSNNCHHHHEHPGHYHQQQGCQSGHNHQCHFHDNPGHFHQYSDYCPNEEQNQQDYWNPHHIHYHTSAHTSSPHYDHNEMNTYTIFGEQEQGQNESNNEIRLSQQESHSESEAEIYYRDFEGDCDRHVCINTENDGQHHCQCQCSNCSYEYVVIENQDSADENEEERNIEVNMNLQPYEEDDDGNYQQHRHILVHQYEVSGNATDSDNNDEQDDERVNSAFHQQRHMEVPIPDVNQSQGQHHQDNYYNPDFQELLQTYDDMGLVYPTGN